MTFRPANESRASGTSVSAIAFGSRDLVRRTQSRLSGRRQLAAILPLLIALMAWFALPGLAADYRLDGGGNGTTGTLYAGVGKSNYAFEINGHRTNAGVLLIHPAGGTGNLFAYCINLPGARNTADIYRDGDRQIDAIAYILNHGYYPQNVHDTGGLGSVNLEAAAIQFAIWSFSDGISINAATMIGSPDGTTPAQFAAIKARASAIRTDALVHWTAWAAQQTARPSVTLTPAPATVTAPATSSTVTATVRGGAGGGRDITFTVTSSDGAVDGTRSVTKPLSNGAATVVVTAAHLDTVTISATTTAVGLAYLRLTPYHGTAVDNAGQVLILASQLPVTGQGTASIPFVGVPALTLAKTVAVNGGAPQPAVSAKPGDHLQYALSYANTGSAATHASTVTDVLNQGALAQADMATVVPQDGGTVDRTHRTISWTVGDVAPGGHGTVHFTLTLPSSIPDNGQGADYCNVGTISGGPAPVSSNQACAHVTTTPGLVAVKTVDVATANLGQTLHYTIAVKNTGNRDLTNVAVTDRLSGHNLELLTNIQPAAAYKSGVVSFTIASLPAGRQTSVTFTADVPASLTHGVDTCFVNVAEAGGGNSGGTYPSPPVTTCVHPAPCVTPTPAVSITGPATITAGQDVTYTVVARNGGSASVYPSSVTVTLPQGFTATATSPKGQVSGQTITFTLPELAAGASQTMTITASVPANQTTGAAVASVTMVGTDNSQIPDCGHPQASTSAQTSGNVEAGAVQGANQGPVSGTAPIVATPSTGSGGIDLLRSAVLGLALIASGLIVMTGARRDPRAR